MEEFKTQVEVTEGIIKSPTGLVNVRKDQTTNSPSVGILKDGDKVTIEETTFKGWSKINYKTNGVAVEGFISHDFIEEIV